ncbi:MAG: diguanylate cyclase [Spirochaetaceae bacterium]|nr:MAG: diguanylate cyclase [Spirochaetaceae bacterium]
MKGQPYRRIGYWITVLLGLYVFISASTVWQQRRTFETEYTNALRILEQEFVTILAGYETAARLIYDEYQFRADFLEPIARATRARQSFGIQPGSPPTEFENQAREQLYATLQPIYRRLKSLGFRQLHVHMPDNSSFLRMHSPEDFGDDLAEVRSTVARANQELTFVRGFEEGRVFSGYRFVMPLFEHGTQRSARSAHTHIGSVELGVGFDTLIRDLGELFDKHYNFVISRRVVKSTVFPEHRTYQKEWCFSPDFLQDPDISCNAPRGERLSSSISSRQRLSIRERLNAHERFAVHVPHRDGDQLLTFLPVSNLEGTVVGYFTSIEQKPALGTYRRSVFMILSILTVASLLIGVLGIQFIRQGRTLEYLAGHDQLTGLFNRRMFEELFRRARAEQSRNEGSMALVVLDIDHFKRINDRRGHIYGDRVLVDLAQTLNEHVRAGDVVGRWGGEEFIILLKSIHYDDAVRVAENLRKAIPENCHDGTKGVTASFGIAEVTLGEEGLEHFVGLADWRMYRAKALGRNRVVSDSLPPANTSKH